MIGRRELSLVPENQAGDLGSESQITVQITLMSLFKICRNILILKGQLKDGQFWSVS